MNKPPLPSDSNEPGASSNQDRHIGVGGNIEGSVVIPGDRNVVGDRNTIYQVQGNYIQAPSTPRSSSEQNLLDQVKAEVASRLRQSLHNAIFIELNKEDQAQQVIRIWDAEVKVGARSPEPLPTDTTILQVFDRPDIAGRLLILGNPGSGKTTTQLELAEALLKRCEQDLNYPTPVLLNLSSWKDERQSMRDWLVAELKSKYGVRQDIAAQWLREMRLLPLLDGLDELPSERQEPCIHALNQFITGESAPLQVVVCSRLEEYEQLGVPLRLNGAICLRELTDSQIQAYLTSAHQPGLWSLLRQDTTLLTLLRAPLLLSMTVLTYQQGLLHQWQTSHTSQERLQSLLDAFIQSQLAEAFTPTPSKHKTSYTCQETCRWLTWLAQQLERESQTEFLIERIQPSWLRSRKLITTYRRLARLIFGVLGGVLGGVFSGLIFGLVGSVLGALIAALSTTLRVQLSTIAVSESLSWSWAEATDRLALWLAFGLILGLAVWLANGLSTGLVVGFSFVLSIWLINGLSAGLTGSELEQKSFPNQGMWKTLQNSITRLLILGLILGLVGALIGGLIGGLANQITLWLVLGLMSGLLGGLGLGLIFGLAGGPSINSSGSLQDCIKHITLRYTLYRNGYVPWNYPRFLNYCTDRLLLQRVGGRYRFMHKLLQEHFAAMPLEQA